MRHWNFHHRHLAETVFVWPPPFDTMDHMRRKLERLTPEWDVERWCYFSKTLNWRAIVFLATSEAGAALMAENPAWYRICCFRPIGGDGIVNDSGWHGWHEKLPGDQIMMHFDFKGNVGQLLNQNK